MVVQIWWTEKVLPEFTDEDKELYSKIQIQQVYPIGSIVEGRRMFRALLEDTEQLISFLTERNKEPIICGIFNQNGEALSDINNSEHDKYLLNYTDELGNIKTQPDNCASGWMNWNERRI